MLRLSRILSRITQAFQALLTIYIGLVLCGLLFTANRVEAAPDVPYSIAVIYPDLGEPYRSIFIKIIEGIENQVRTQARSSLRSYPISASTNAAELNSLLRRNGTKVVIALGRQGVKISSQLDREMTLVVGGILSLPEAESRTLTGISLTPDPALLFMRLKSLLPSIKRVVVVYDPKYSEWLIRIAREAARAQGLELIAYEANSLAIAAQRYAATFASSDSKEEAIWLPQDATTVDENILLPLILKESWRHNIAVFSSSLPHVRKGVLFALYPNNEGLGHTLANTALSTFTGGTKRATGILPLRDVYTAVNLRTASHIGLTINAQQQHNFDFVFPEP